MTPLLELVGAGRAHPMGDTRVDALRGVSLSVDKGECISIQGPSGSGKSTLLNLLGLLDRPSEGDLMFLGMPTRTMNHRELALLRNRHIGFVFQQFHLLPHLNALENVGLPLRYAGRGAAACRQSAADALAAVGLASRLRHLPSQLSGGERQRVAIARALVARPELLLADEPTGALDTNNGAVILDLLARLQRELGMTVILVTHDSEISMRMPRRILLRDGCIESDHGPH